MCFVPLRVVITRTIHLALLADTVAGLQYLHALASLPRAAIPFPTVDEAAHAVTMPLTLATTTTAVTPFSETDLSAGSQAERVAAVAAAAAATTDRTFVSFNSSSTFVLPKVRGVYVCVCVCSCCT